METSILKESKLINTWSSRNEVIIYYIDSKNKRHLKKISFSWYFAIKESDLKKANKIIKENNFIVRYSKSKNFPEFIKIYCFLNPEVKYSLFDIVISLEKNNINTYEGDLSPAKRWIIDNNVVIETDRYNKLYFDIETEDSSGKITIGEDRIISFAAIDNNGRKYFTKLSSLTDSAEKIMLKNIADLLKKFDIIIGWNSSEFDKLCLRERMKKLQVLSGNDIYHLWNYFAHIDLLKRFRHVFRFDSKIKNFSLDYVSKYFLNKGKIERGSTKIIELYKNDQKKLKKYNLEDAILVKELDEKLDITSMMIRQSAWCGVPISMFGLYSIIDSHFLKTAHRHGKFLQTSKKAIEERIERSKGTNLIRTKSSKKEQKYLGGLVLDAQVGLYKNVYSFDYKSLYPSIIKTSNIGHETLLFKKTDDCIINPGTRFLKRASGNKIPTYFSKNLSIMNIAVSYLMTKRKEYKDKKLEMIEKGEKQGPLWERIVSDEIIVKELSNSCYGIMGLEYGRYYSPDIAESITLFGQWCILFAKYFFEKQGYKVIYGDTDSVFFSSDEKIEIIELLEKFHKELAKTLKNKYNISESFIELEPDKEYENFILFAKKSYVGHITKNERKKVDMIYARGLEFLKRDSFSYGSNKQQELINLIFKNSSDINNIKKWLVRTKKEFYQTNFSKQELTIIQKVGKPLKDYTAKTLPIHIRLATEKVKRTGENLTNSEIEYIVTSFKPKIDGIFATDFKGFYDKDYYWSKKTAALLKKILKIVYPSEDWTDLLMDKGTKLEKERKRIEKELKKNQREKIKKKKK